MSDIDFLANKKTDDDHEPKTRDDKAEPVVWSEPDKNKPLIKETPFSLLAFLNKKKTDDKTASAAKPALKRNKIIESRREILKLIKAHGNSEQRAEKKISRGWLAGLLGKFKKLPSHKEVLIDYQQVFDREKVKRSLAVDRLTAAKFGSSARQTESRAQPAAPTPLTGPPKIKNDSPKAGSRSWGWGSLIKQMFNRRPALEKKSAAAQPERSVKAIPVPVATAKIEPAPRLKAPRAGFFSRFFKMIKAKIAALNRPALKPVKADLTGANLSAIVKIPTPPPATSAAVEKKEVKAMPPEPAKINEKYQPVIETNLIKGEIITFFDWRKKIIILINAILIPTFSLAVIYFGLTYYQKQNQAERRDQDKKLSDLTAEIKPAQAGLKEATDFQARLATVSQIFNQHIYWTNLFKFLEEQTIKDVYYTGFSGDIGGNYSLSAVALRFSNISEQVNSLRNNEKVTAVKTMGGEAALSGADKNKEVKFNLDLSVSKSIFIE